MISNDRVRPKAAAAPRVMKVSFCEVRRISCLLLPVMVAIAAAGCRSANPGISNHMASIIVTNRSSEDIDAATRAVFEKQKYVEGKSDDDKLVFEKPGSFMSGLVYSDWYSGGVWERILVYQRDLKPGETVVECDGYMVKEHDDPLFSVEKREYKTKQGHLQNLMDEIALDLKTRPVGTNAPPATGVPAMTNAPPDAK